MATGRSTSRSCDCCALAGSGGGSEHQSWDFQGPVLEDAPLCSLLVGPVWTAGRVRPELLPCVRVSVSAVRRLGPLLCCWLSSARTSELCRSRTRALTEQQREGLGVQTARLCT